MLVPILITMMLASPVKREQLVLAGYIKGMPIVFEAAPIPGKDINQSTLLLNKEAAGAWKEMIVLAAKRGIFLQPTYAFRDHQTQKRLRKKLPHLAARPGYSAHESGVAIDIDNCIKRVKGKKQYTETYRWLQKNAEQFGFKQTLHYEPWHWEWIGK
jgi:LAS superfamily LD-carboxypeptidase LdcB